MPVSRKWAVQAVGLSIIVFVSFAALETALQTQFRINNGHWLVVGRPTLKVFYVKPVDDRRKYTLAENVSFAGGGTDEHGFRKPSLNSTDTRPLICVMGDSVPFGSGVDDEHTFPALLQSILNDRNLKYSVLNGGVPSYNLRQALDRWAVEVKPNWKCAIIVLHSVNDVSQILKFKERWTPDVTWADREAFGLSAIMFYVNAILEKSAAKGEGWKEASFKWLNESFLEQLKAPLRDNIPVVLLSANPCYYTNLPYEDSRSVKSCENWKDYEVLARDWQPLIEKQNEMLAKVQQQNVSFIDTNPAMNKNGRDGRFVDFIHFTDQGNLEIATMIADHLESRGLVKR
jgi:lysophospholipase L1-like esterase